MSALVDLGSVQPGFAHPSLDAQRSYRRLLDALSRPGTVQDLSEGPEPPEGLTRAAAAIALTLVDFETRLWLSPALRTGQASAWFRFHCNAPLVTDPGEADFAFIDDMQALPEFAAFCAGDARYPDRSSTLILQLPSLQGGEQVVLEGPGIDGQISIAPQGLPDTFWPQFAENGARFQLGLDFFLVDDESVLGLPRSSRRLADHTSSGES